MEALGHLPIPLFACFARAHHYAHQFAHTPACLRALQRCAHPLTPALMEEFYFDVPYSGCLEPQCIQHLRPAYRRRSLHMDRQKDRHSLRRMDIANEQEKVYIVITTRDTAKHSIALRT